MWWFAPAPLDGGGGRFDLPAPNGSCYAATSFEVALLEALGDFSGGMIPRSALEARKLSTVEVPSSAPKAADLTAQSAAGVGVDVSLWADGDRALTQRWAVELHGSGWQAIHHGACHEPTGAGRSVTFFDAAGEHPPWGGEWAEPASTGLWSEATVAALRTYGIEVAATAPTLELHDRA